MAAGRAPRGQQGRSGRSAAPALRPWLFLAAALMCLMRAATAMEFDMQVQTKCIYEELNSNVIVVGDWKAYNKNNPTLPIYVSVKVADATGAPVHTAQSQSHGQFAFTTKSAGEYSVCFTAHGAAADTVHLRSCCRAARMWMPFPVSHSPAPCCVMHTHRHLHAPKTPQMLSQHCTPS